jgi:UDP-2,4-diacetamido-2,4,6-trideoxy-beta-L-altropyranose hydrolase
MGTGHVMRCLALAQAWQDAGGQAVFAMVEAPPTIRQRLLAENMEVAMLESLAGSEDDAKGVGELAKRHAATWAVVDGYQFGAAYQREVKASGQKLLFVDDNGHADHYAADIVLNQNAHANEGLYPNREPYTQLLLGPRYVLLRREFKQWRNWTREIARIGRKVLVTMGGSDPDNVTARIINALELLKMQGLHAVVVVGGSNPHFENLRRPPGHSNVRLQIDVPNISELMAWADVAVSAAGTTCLEMCLLGLPAMLISLAENQRPIAHELGRTHCAIYIGESSNVTAENVASKLEWFLLSPEIRATCSRSGRELVDGQGAPRVVSVIQNHSAE